MSDDDASATPSLEEMLCFDIYATQHALAEVYNPLLAPLRLTYPQYLVLVMLWQADEAVSVGELGRRLGLETSTLSQLVKRMEAAGHVHRRRAPADDRRVDVVLTEAGRRLRTEARHIPDRVAVATGLEQHELAALRRRIGQVRRALARAARGASDDLQP